MSADSRLLAILLMVTNLAAAVATTAFPVLYSRSPWRDTIVGRALMMHSIAFAIAADTSLFFLIWKTDNIVLLRLVYSIVFSGVAITNFVLTAVMWRLNNPKEIQDEAQ